ncbi:MAG: iron-sulfur cluster carrier protein ApbC [Alphaproteobacteria bacterium]|nr:iron-sulfur cluster carrier protein ApbC [Alphaproteobacteria bacterium]
MADVSENMIWEALQRVIDPESGKDVVALGIIKGMIVKGGNIGFTIEVDPAKAAQKEALRKACEAAVEDIPGVLSVTAVLTAHRDAHPHPHPHPHPQPQAQARPAAGRPQKPVGGAMLLTNVRAVIAVASGKGGVGKSTVATNLAVALGRGGFRVGLLDADIYGPSMPRMMAISGQPVSHDGHTLEPMENYGIKVMSIGFLVEEDTPMIWRGPMVMSALEQMMRDVAWGELDIMVVDMPPGTGDAQLTMAQRVPLAGAVIVSTPQDIALIDARKGLNMFRKVDVPVFGIIENMSYFLCPSCGHRSEIFGHGGARETAAKLGVDFLGEVPLHMSIRETSDSGKPITATQPDSEYAKIFMQIADRVAAKVADVVESKFRQPPKIVIQ